MKQWISGAALAAVMAFVSVPAQAQDFYFAPYVGGGLGAYELDYGNGSDFVFGGYGALGADVHDNLGLEVRFGSAASKTKLDAQLGSVNVKAQVDWFASYLAKPQAEIFDGLKIYGLIGATTLKSKLTPTGSAARSNTSTGLSFGVGGEYRIANQLLLGVEWMRYSSDKDRAVVNGGGFNGLDVNGFVANLKYEF